ncbi:hypothetical protein SA496_14085 [Pseudomonas sp. JS3066]|jgi:hypothetical protein|uniref:hypothetical protein n=1 Tax=unclassified Pseudomonas TaxID=196821 RepID=UPI000EA9C45F|nr:MULTISPECIES: hypothetical protein [unclassified Pseudomonas]AYF86313.1 hypothetical protein D6Z43_03695 [Pseudomonas sp. DY-1]MDH4653905.1 hypothetical protein [Pseudomonas sp. BN606]MRK22690.1 hypothetical protein [Pseudomonas sp. JG-B]WVK96234.1 hypothetical protein SA496_14085 [Pseudomonas sp. JS3066]
MEISIQQVIRGDRLEWLVEALGMKVPFRDRASALAFAVRLQERVEAPHWLPNPEKSEGMEG